MIRKDTLIVSGDQGLHWDAYLKLEVLKRHGFQNIQHLVHSADVFGTSRNGTGLQRDYIMPDGNLSQWAASLWLATFLGKVAILPDFSEFGISLEKICAYTGETTYDAVKRLSTSDCYGVSIGDRAEVSHSVSCSEVKKFSKALFATIRKDLEVVLGRVVSNEEMNMVFPGLGSGQNSITIGKAFQNILTEWVGFSVGTSLEHFSVKNLAHFHRMIELFYRPDVTQAYNHAVKKTKVGILPLERRELPFFAVIREKEGEKTSYMRSSSLYYVGDERVGINGNGKRFSLSEVPEEIVAIVPKAIPLLLYFRSQGCLALPENGSVYTPAAVAFANLLGFSQHPILRVQFNALDSLRGIADEVYLPYYLQEFFGISIALDDFSQSWRGVLKNAEAELEKIKALDEIGKMSYLMGNRLIDSSIVDEVVRIDEQFSQKETKLKELYQKGNGNGNPRASFLMQCMRESVEQGQFHANFLNRHRKFLEGYIHNAIAERVTKLYQGAHSLEYWNTRPFHHWLRLIGGGQWYYNVMENATVDAT